MVQSTQIQVASKVSLWFSWYFDILAITWSYIPYSMNLATHLKDTWWISPSLWSIFSNHVSSTCPIWNHYSLLDLIEISIQMGPILHSLTIVYVLAQDYFISFCQGYQLDNWTLDFISAIVEWNLGWILKNLPQWTYSLIWYNLLAFFWKLLIVNT